MAEITVRMVFNRETGKKDIWIDFESDEDALPFEHEKQHREVIGKLLGSGVLQPNELGDVVVKRGRETAPLKPQETPAAPIEEPVANKFEAFRSAADASPRSWKGSDLSTGRAPARSLVNKS